MQHFYRFTKHSIILSLQDAGLAATREVHLECVDHQSRQTLFAPVGMEEVCDILLQQSFNLVTGRLFVNVADTRWALPQPFAFPEHRLGDHGFVDAWLDQQVRRSGKLARAHLLRGLVALASPRSRPAMLLQEESLRATLRQGAGLT